MPDFITGYVVLALAALTAVAIKIDAHRRDPYFALTDLVPGSAITTALADGDKYARRAVISRFSFPLVLGVVLGVVAPPQAWHAAMGGAILAGLMLWPIVFRGLPRGVLRSDWWLLPLYAGFVAAYAGAALLGQQFVLIVAKGDLLGYARDQALQFLVGAALVAIGTGLLPISARRRPGP